MENNLNMVLAKESASDYHTLSYQKEPENILVFTSYPDNEYMVENFVQYFTVDVEKSKDVVKTNF